MATNPEQVFSWSEVKELWLRGGELAVPAEEIVNSFNQVAARFGRVWVEATGTERGSVVRGPGTVLRLVELGQMLASLPVDTPNSGVILEKLRSRNPKTRDPTWLELMAIHIICSVASGIELEIEPTILVENRTARPDFRVRKSGDSWSYVEAKQATESDDERYIRRAFEKIITRARQCEGDFSVEIFLKKDPTAREIDEFITEIASRRQVTDPGCKELSAGKIYWNADPTTRGDHPERSRTPSLVMTAALVGGNTQKYISVHQPFKDTRVRTFLSDKAKQLPRDSPGLVVLGTNGAVGSITVWQSLVEQWFQSKKRPHISAVCLVGEWPISIPLSWHPRTKLIANPHARFALPDWMPHQLERFSLRPETQEITARRGDDPAPARQPR